MGTKGLGGGGGYICGKVARSWLQKKKTTDNANYDGVGIFKDPLLDSVYGQCTSSTRAAVPRPEVCVRVREKERSRDRERERERETARERVTERYKQRERKWERQRQRERTHFAPRSVYVCEKSEREGGWGRARCKQKERECPHASRCVAVQGSRIVPSQIAGFLPKDTDS